MQQGEVAQVHPVHHHNNEFNFSNTEYRITLVSELYWSVYRSLLTDTTVFVVKQDRQDYHPHKVVSYIPLIQADPSEPGSAL